MIHKIPLSFHRETQRLLTVMAAQRGKQCDCECPECGEPLIAAKGALRQYFKHANDTSDCQGRPETLGHRLAEEILTQSSIVYTSSDVPFSYEECDIEQKRYGKRPDAYLINTADSLTLIAEIRHSNAKTNETLQWFWNNKENVLEINIQGYHFDEHFSYGAFKQYVLQSGPRTLHVCPVQAEQSPVQVTKNEMPFIEKESDWFISLLLSIVLFFAGWYFLEKIVFQKWNRHR